jgi:hypothetical protein
MTEQQNSSGDLDNHSENETKEQRVSYETHRKLLGEKKRLQEERDSLLAKSEASELERLEQDGKLSEQLEFYKSKNTEALTKVEELTLKLNGEQDKWNTARKLNAFKDALPGQLVSSKFLIHVPVDDILLDPETGEPDSHSVKKVVDFFTQEFAEVIKPKTTSTSPSKYPQGNSSGKLSLDDWKKLPYDERIKRKSEINRN